MKYTAEMVGDGIRVCRKQEEFMAAPGRLALVYLSTKFHPFNKRIVQSDLMKKETKENEKRIGKTRSSA